MTIVPPVTLRNFWNLVSDPSRSDMEEYIQRGMVAAFQKISMVRQRLRVDVALGHLGPGPAKVS